MRGSQNPRIKIEPPRSDTDGEGAKLLMREYGLELDEWQQIIVDCWLGKDKYGNYTTTSAGLSVPRQNGKNVCLEAREFYGLIVNGERILHTAHQMRTAKKAFYRLEAMFTDKRHPEIMRLVKKIRYGIGEESIALNNGGVIEFAARSRQAARGYDGISLVVYDEAQELTDEQAEAIMSVLSASATGTRQLIYTGTPPYIGCNCDVFRRLRESCINDVSQNESIKSAWHEWSVAGDSITDFKPGDRELWYATNPALGSRLTEEFTSEEFKTLSEDGFARERLGWWSKRAGTDVVNEYAIDKTVWDACKSDEKKTDGKTAYGIKFAPDGTEFILAGAVLPAEGKGRISIIDRQPTAYGLSRLASWLNERNKVGSVIVIDGKGGADVLIDKINTVWTAKNSIIKANANVITAAASMLINELSEETITWYSGQLDLNDSAITSLKRKIGTGFGFGGDNSLPIEAVSLALWGCKTSKRQPQKRMRIG